MSAHEAWIGSAARASRAAKNGTCCACYREADRRLKAGDSATAVKLCHTVTHDSVLPYYFVARSKHHSNAQTSLPGRFFVAATPRGTAGARRPHPA